MRDGSLHRFLPGRPGVHSEDRQAVRFPRARLRAYWAWLAVDLVVLIPLDLLTTWIAVARFGLVVEANPFMRWLLGQPPSVILAVHAIAVFVICASFAVTIRMLALAQPPNDRRLARVVEGWLGTFLVIGLVTLANNLSALAYGRTLL